MTPLIHTNMSKTANDMLRVALIALTLAMAMACSTTSGVPEGDKLYVGIKKIEFENYEDNEHFDATREEVEAALDCPPNGGLFGSSYYRSPLQTRLWIWNTYHEKETKFAKWMTNSFGKAPVLMSNVNPELRASVAQSALNVHGYFRGTVTSHEVEMDNPKKAKVGYNVNMGHLFTVDTLEYDNFPEEAMALIDSTAEEAYVYPGVPFDVSTLDAERNRIASLFRDNGYYYYQAGYASYLADTLATPGKVKMKLQLADSLPDKALRKWYIGKFTVNLKRTFMEQANNTREGRRFTVNFNGERSPIRMRALMNDIKIRPGRQFNYTDYMESSSRLSSNGLFSMVDFNFTPRDSSETCDTLDVSLSCIFEKPYDFYVESNVRGKTTGFVGPEMVIGLTRRNALRGGEKLDVNLHGSYEWQTGHGFEESSSRLNSYEYGFDVSLEVPRLLVPWEERRASSRRRRRTRFFSTPSTVIKVSRNIVNRSGYFKRHILSGELTYKFQKNQHWMHVFTPLSVEYNYLKNGSDKFYDLLSEHPYLMTTMLDQFIPKLKYTLAYSSMKSSRNPVYWQTSISEAGNVLSLGYVAAGKKWGEKDKELFKNPYAQFIKIETDFTKTWNLDEHSSIVGHLNAGYAWVYGNSNNMPYTEQFWVGGANSVRAFSVRSIGPGNYHSKEKKWRFLEEVGDMKLQANLELRSRLFGKLYGAFFIDAGNVWYTKEYEGMEDCKFKFSNLPKQLALGTGVGLRYDLDFFVVRIDWGIGIHAPYDTGKSGYYNIPSFRDGQSLHFAIGYPF